MEGKVEYCPQAGYEQCPNGVYIPEYMFCDGWEDDCVNNYDEREEICASKWISFSFSNNHLYQTHFEN